MTIAKYPEHRVYLSAADFRGFFRGSSAKLPRNFRDTVFLRNLLFGMSGHVCLVLSGPGSCPAVTVLVWLCQVSGVWRPKLKQNANKMLL